MKTLPHSTHVYTFTLATYKRLVLPRDTVFFPVKHMLMNITRLRFLPVLMD